MIRTYKLQIYANRDKKIKLLGLIRQFQSYFREAVDIFWELSDLRGSYAPSEFRSGTRLKRNAVDMAWTLVRKTKQKQWKRNKDNQYWLSQNKSFKVKKAFEKPDFTGEIANLSWLTAKTNFTSKEFDFWVKITSGTTARRMMIPCKKHRGFNKAMSRQGVVKNTFGLWKDGKNRLFLVAYVETPNKVSNNAALLGIDVGLSHPIVTSDGNFYAEDIKPFRIKTKHRKYTNTTPATKQRMNFYAKQLVKTYPNTDFVVEDLHFKGKSKKRSREFRRRNNTWPYKQLAKSLEILGSLEGFKVILVPPEFSSQRCSACGHVSEGNRKGDSFRCLACDFANHSDTNAAINLLGRVPRECSSAPVSSETKAQNNFVQV